MLALMAALVGPYFVDWTSYRADFEREASLVLGRRVTVQGAATATLLPFPSVTFSDVSVGAAEGKPAMTIETFSMDAELAPFLRGEFLIFDMRMVRPKARIDIAADGAVDWAMRPSTPFDPKRISLEKLTVTEGQIEIHDAASDRTHLLSEINTEVSAKSFAGPWRAAGSLRVNGMLAKITGSTGTLDEAGQMRLRLRAEPEQYRLSLETDGNVRMEAGALRYAGQFKMNALEESAETAGKEAVAKAEPGNRLSGKFALDHDRLAIDEFRFETGPLDNPYTADGKASVELGAAPRFAIEADGAQVRFDEAVGGDPKASLSLAERLAALETALADLPKPNIPGTVKVKLPAVVVGDTTIRDVRLSSEPVEDGWAIKSFAATLPGRTRLEADGLLRTAGEFGFSGSLLLAVGQPSGFAAWLSKDVDDAIRRLPAAGFSAKVEMTGERQAFSDLELVLGGAKFHGSIESSQPAETRPSVLVKLEGGALDVSGLAAFASLFVSDEGANRFADRDVDFEIKAGPVSAGELTAETVDTALRLRNGLLEIDRLAIGGLAGASISATGTIRDFANNPTGNLDASVIAVDLAPLVSFAATRYPGNALIAALDKRAARYNGLLSDTRIDIVASAAANGDGTTGLAVSIQGDAGQSAISATLTGNGRPDAIGQAPISLAFSARNDDATALLALAGLPAIPLGATGQGELNLSAKGALAIGLATDFSLSGEDFSAKFAGTASLGEGFAAKGKVQLEAADIEPWLMTTGVSLPGMGLGMPADFSADADYANGLLVLGGFAGSLDENSVSGDINAEIKDGLPHLTGALALDVLDFEPVAAMLFGENSVVTQDGAWASVPFQPKASVPFTAEMDLSAATLSAGLGASAYDASMSLKLDGEGLRVGGLRAKLFGGDLAGLFELKNNAGTGLFTGQMKLSGADLATALPQNGVAGAGDFSTQLSGSGKSASGMIATLSGSGTATLHGLHLSGLNAQAFPALIAKADAIGRDIDAAKTAEFAPAIAGEGTFAANDAEIAFTLASGVLRAPPISLEDPAATLTSDFRADFNTGHVAADGTITYRPGNEALVGSDPAMRFSLEGPFEAPARSFDSEPLTQFLTQRALEREQARVEAMQAALLEKQRLRREVRYYAALVSERERIAEAARLKAEAEEKARLEAEAKAKAEEEARLQAAAEAAEFTRRKAEEDAQRAVIEARRQKEEQAMREAAEKARQTDQGTTSEIERAPLPQLRADPPAPAIDVPAETRRRLQPFSIDDFMKSFQ